GWGGGGAGAGVGVVAPSVRVPAGHATPCQLRHVGAIGQNGLALMARRKPLELVPDLSSYACGRAGLLPGRLSPDGRKSVMAASSRTSTFRGEAGRSGIGASRPLRCVPAKVTSTIRQRPPSLGGANHPKCP